MKLSFVPAAFLAVLALAAVVRPASAQYVYVGSWDLATIDGGYGDGSNPYLWVNNPQCYSGVSAAALLFGGTPSEYVTSTVDSNPAHINYLAYVDGYGDDQFLYSPASDAFSLQTGSGYSDPGLSGTSYSAYVVDHAPFDGTGSFVNYAFRYNAPPVSTPEPSALATVVSLGLAGVALKRHRRRI